VNLGEIKTALKRYGFDDTDPLTLWINAAMHEFEDAYPWPWLEREVFLALLVGEREVLVPSDFYKLISLKWKERDSRPVYLGIDEFEEAITDRTITGPLPSVFTMVGMERILVWPTASENLDIEFIYRKELPDLVDDDDIPGIPTRHHYGLVAGAASYALQAENEEERSQTAQGLWQAVIDRAIARYGTRQEQGTDSVRDEAGYFDNQDLGYAPFRRP
jgi:hypothetical protein